MDLTLHISILITWIANDSRDSCWSRSHDSDVKLGELHSSVFQ
jgi:hypothetical protein